MYSSSVRTTKAFLFAITFLALSAAPAQAQFGVSAGLNFDSLSDIETTTSNNATVDNANGYHLGVVYDLGLGPLSLRPGFFYRKVGTYEFPDETSDVTAWEVPVDVRLTVIPTPVISAYVLGGPNAFFPQGEGEFDGGLKDVSYTFNIGVGADVSIPNVGLTLQPELRYEFGASNYIDEDFEVGGANFEASDRKLSAFALRLNVLF
jgi:hypothetical protein